MKTLNLSGDYSSRPLLAWMPFIKLGDFILLTPSLQELQKRHPNLVVAVPDLLWDLYRETHVFEKSILASTAEKYLEQQKEETLILAWTPEKPSSQESLPTTKSAAGSFGPVGQAFLELSPKEEILKEVGVKPFYYYTVHLDSCVLKKELVRSFETTIEMISERYPEIKCVYISNPQGDELFEDRDAPENLKTIHVDVRQAAHILAGSLFHIDCDSGLNRLATALDVPSVIVSPDYDHKLWTTSLKPTYLMASAEKILSAYDHF